MGFIFRLIAIAAGVGSLFSALGCSGGEKNSPPPPLDPLDPPPPDRTREDPPGTVYKCDPPQNSFLLLFRGYGASYPTRIWETVEEEDGTMTRRVTENLAPSPPRTACSVWSVNRLGASEGTPTEAGIPYWSDVKWSNLPNPFPSFDDADYLNAVDLLQGRGLEHTLGSLFRGFPGTDLRREGSWGQIFALPGAGLPELAQNVSLALMVKMVINPTTCQADLELWQAVRRPDGLETASLPLVLPLYREEACFAAEEVPPADNEQVVTICDDSTPTPCETLGMTGLDKLEVIVKALPIGVNPEMVADGMMEENVVSGALASFEDEGIVVVNVTARRPRFSFQLPSRPADGR